MQPATTLTIASVGAEIAGSGTSETRMSRVPWIVVARMAPILSGPSRRSPATPRSTGMLLRYLICELPWLA